MGVKNLANEELKALMAANADLLLLDVRSPQEYLVLGHIPGSKLIPIYELQAALPTLDPARKTVVICEHGIRSADASNFLAHCGFVDVANLTAGMAEWDGPREFDQPLTEAQT